MSETDTAANPSESKTKKVLALIGFALVLFWIFGGGSQQHAEQIMDDAAEEVAQDAIAQYEIAKRSGEAVDRCVHAGFVAAAFIQAENEAKYAEWKAIEKQECAAHMAASAL